MTAQAQEMIVLRPGASSGQNSLCPQCGSEVSRSPLYPHGRDSGGAIRKARICPKQGISFGLASDGSWSIPVAPLNINRTSANQRRA